VIRENFKRISRADVVLVAPSRVPSHFPSRLLPDANFAVLDRPEPSDPVIEQIVQATPKALGLLVPKIADVEGRVLELPFQLRPARFPQVREQVSKLGLERSQACWSAGDWPNHPRLGEPSISRKSRARRGRKRVLRHSKPTQIHRPPNDPPFSSAFCEISMVCGDFSLRPPILLQARPNRTLPRVGQLRNQCPL
jgi:hypothetical protein